MEVFIQYIVYQIKLNVFIPFVKSANFKPISYGQPAYKEALPSKRQIKAIIHFKTTITKFRIILISTKDH